ncbi:DUF2177 family protein [Halovulum sp. GXIMD14794]
MAYLWIYLAMLVAFLAVDAVWLTQVMRPLFERHVGDLLREDILLSAAAGFYLAYVVGILWFCVLPGLREDAVLTAVGRGLALGFLAYGTYEFTNMTTLKGWSWSMVAVDTAWGMVLTGGTAAVGVWVGRAVGVSAG